MNPLPSASKGEGRIKRSGISGKLEMVVRPRATTMPSWWKLGRRVWLTVVEGHIEITRTPKGSRQGRRASTRIKRSLYALHSPRRTK